MRIGDFSERLLHPYKIRLSLLPKFFSLLCCLICPLLCSGGLLARNLRLYFRVRLVLFGQVALLSGYLRVRSRLRGLLSQRL